MDNLSHILQMDISSIPAFHYKSLMEIFVIPVSFFVSRLRIWYPLLEGDLISFVRGGKKRNLNGTLNKEAALWLKF